MLVYIKRVKTQHSLLDINPLGLSLRTHTHLHCCQTKLQRIIKVDWVILVKLLKNEDCAKGKQINQHQQLVNMGKEYSVFSSKGFKYRCFDCACLFENVVQRMEVNTRNSSGYPLLNNQLAQARSICGQFAQHSFDGEFILNYNNGYFEYQAITHL